MSGRSTFSVDMLCDDMGRSILCPGNVNIRLDRLLHKKIKNPTLEGRFWYTAQLYLHRFCGLNHNTALRDILLHCGRNSDIGKSYDFRQLLPEQDKLATDCRRVETYMFQENAFVKTRDLGCPSIGYSVHEVFRTLQCMIEACQNKQELTYCEVFGCGSCRPKYSIQRMIMEILAAEAAWPDK